MIVFYLSWLSFSYNLVKCCLCGCVSGIWMLRRVAQIVTASHTDF